MNKSMELFGSGAISEFYGDQVVYRNLSPMDQRLPSLDEMRAGIGLAAGAVPRKNEDDYARVIVSLLRRCRELDAPGTPIKRLIFIGDTRMNDGTAFANICRVGDWPGLIFIGSEKDAPLSVEEVRMTGGRIMFLANRWRALAGAGEDSFVSFCNLHQFPIDEGTAVVIDIDKTAIGGRGRNDHVIDQARVQAVRDTVEGLLAENFDQALFLKAYNQLNQVEFHPFTADNQDYLAYICMVLGSDLYDLETVVAQVRAGELATFRQFIDQVEAASQSLPASLAEVHADIYENVLKGDPTPFKPFRRNEYRNTIARLGQMTDSAPVERMLAEEIVITQEVRQLALDWKSQGALLFGLSDKPDEASIPTAELEKQGYKPIHRTETHAVGEAV
jgi:hypothetical protein